MQSDLKKITETVSEGIKDASEVVRERLFSPMYFYFFVAWIITNWKFSYALFFVDEQNLAVPKIEYLVSFYRAVNIYDYIWNFFELLFIPAISAYMAVWWLSLISEKFYKQNEQYKANKIAIKRGIDYTEQIRAQRESIILREIEYEKPDINYEDNPEFNEHLDDLDEKVVVSGIPMLPSEVLYKTDYQAYKGELFDWIDSQVDSHLSMQADTNRGK